MVWVAYMLQNSSNAQSIRDVSSPYIRHAKLHSSKLLQGMLFYNLNKNVHSHAFPAETVKVPQMSESITEGTLKTWSKQVGDTVAVDDEVATIETDKARDLMFRPINQTQLSAIDRRIRERPPVRKDCQAPSCRRRYSDRWTGPFHHRTW